MKEGLCMCAYVCFFRDYFNVFTALYGYAVAKLVEALCYLREGHRFNS